MSDRITRANLLAVMGRMSRAMEIPEGLVWSRDEHGNNRARVGALVLDIGSKINGISWGISQIVNESGGQRALIRGTTARELWDRAQSWLDGFDSADRRHGSQS